MRYNTTVDAYEAYFGGANAGWRSFATGSSSVNNASNLGGGQGVFVQNNNGNLEFKSLLSTGAITLNNNNSTITVGDDLTLVAVGAGESVIKQRNINALEFKTVKADNNITVSSTPDEITISGDTTIKKTTAQTTDATYTEVLFNSSRIAPDNNQSWFVTVTAIGRRTNGVGTMAIKREAVVDNSNGTITIVSNEGNTVNYTNNVSSNWELVFYDDQNDFRVFVKGEAGNDINWAVQVDFLPVS